MISTRALGARAAHGFLHQRHVLLPRQAIQRLKTPEATFRCLRRPQTTYVQAPPSSARPTLSRRIYRGVLTYVAISGSAFLIGAYIALAYLPNKEALVALFTTHPVSDAQTLELFKPADEASRVINERLLNAPLAQELRATGRFTEARPHLKIPDALKPTNLTGGTLAGAGRITVPPLLFNDGGNHLTALIHLGPQLCGHPGIIHGGLLATLLDEGLARCCFPALPGKVGVTASLTVNYRKPVRADRFYALRAETLKIEGRKAWVKGWIEEADCEGQTAVRGPDGQKLVLCEAQGLFVSPKNAEIISKVYTGAT